MKLMKVLIKSHARKETKPNHEIFEKILLSLLSTQEKNPNKQLALKSPLLYTIILYVYVFV